MKRVDEAGHISRLCAALARITASLDPEAVLAEVAEDAARSPARTRELLFRG